MNFEDWWNTLTIKEQTLIGKNNAKFVWSAACEECALFCEDDGNYDGRIAYYSAQYIRESMK